MIHFVSGVVFYPIFPCVTSDSEEYEDSEEEDADEDPTEDALGVKLSDSV